MEIKGPAARRSLLTATAEGQRTKRRGVRVASGAAVIRPSVGKMAGGNRNPATESCPGSSVGGQQEALAVRGKELARFSSDVAVAVGTDSSNGGGGIGRRRLQLRLRFRFRNAVLESNPACELRRSTWKSSRSADSAAVSPYKIRASQWRRGESPFAEHKNGDFEGNPPKRGETNSALLPHLLGTRSANHCQKRTYEWRRGESNRIGASRNRPLHHI